MPFSKSLQIPSPLMCKTPPEFCKWSSFTHNATLSSKFREVNGKANKLEQFSRELPPSFPDLSEMF